MSIISLLTAAVESKSIYFVEWSQIGSAPAHSWYCCVAEHRCICGIPPPSVEKQKKKKKTFIQSVCHNHAPVLSLCDSIEMYSVSSHVVDRMLGKVMSCKHNSHISFHLGHLIPLYVLKQRCLNRSKLHFFRKQIGYSHFFSLSLLSDMDMNMTVYYLHTKTN